MSSFLIQYTRRRLGRDRPCTGHYVTFEYNPMRDAYRAIVRPSTSLGQHAVELSDITNLPAFAAWLARRIRLGHAQHAMPRPTQEISLPTGDNPMCLLDGADPHR